MCYVGQRGGQGAHAGLRCEGGTPWASHKSCWWRWWRLGWCLLRRCVWEHPPFVLLPFPFGSLCFVSSFVSLFLCSTDTPMSMGESSSNGRMLPSLPTLKTKNSQTFTNQIVSTRSVESVDSSISQFSYNQLIILSKNSASVLNVMICCLSLSFMIVNEESLGVGLSVGQKKIAFGSGKLWWAFCHLLFDIVD